MVPAVAVSPATAQDACSRFLFQEAAIDAGYGCADLPPVIETGIVVAEPPGKRGRVRGIVDSDTLRVSFGGTEERVRLVMANTPETYPDTESYGHEAAYFLASLIGPGSVAWFERGITERDRYDRLLAYVWVARPDGTYQLLQDAIVADGYAEIVIYPPNDRYSDWLFERQNAAIATGVGKWGACGNGVVGEPGEAMGIAAGVACNPAYPTMCIPSVADAGGDHDCRDIPYRRFVVLPPDPHKFDGDGNGTGCERV
jgi:micrococcal nuclease